MTSEAAEKFKLLTDVEHVLLRPGRYVGSTKARTEETWTLENDRMVRKEVTWNPGLIKIFDEIISNSVDHSKRPEGKHLDTIRVSIERSTGTITVEDNGGIPVVIHPEHQMLIPTMIFGHLRSGSNFDDDVDSTGTGQNGEGSSLTNIFSKEFKVETSDGKMSFSQTWTDNMHVVGPTKTWPGGKGFTKITFKPDYERLETELDEGNFAKISKRVWDVAGCNPNLKIWLNGRRIEIKSFSDYVKLYTDEAVVDESGAWSVGVSVPDGGSNHVSFVNTTETTIGGTHVMNVRYQIAHRIRDYVFKKHKIDMKPMEIMNHFCVFINAVIVRPRYDSQTKENLITEPKEYQISWTISDEFTDKILKSGVVQRVLDWAAAKQKAIELAELRKLNKETEKINPRRIVKLQDATLAGKEPERCILFLTEGDSAAKSGQSARDAKTMGFLALRGKPLNVNAIDPKKRSVAQTLSDNAEFFNMIVALGLKIGEKVTDPSKLRYSRIGIMTDADHDGAGHITGLLINNLHHFWPELFKMGVVCRFVTPLVKVWVGNSKKALSFYDEHEYADWREKNPTAKYRSKYYKGLATSQTSEFVEYLNNINDHLIEIKIESKEDSDIIDLAFSKSAGSADARKRWLRLED